MTLFLFLSVNLFLLQSCATVGGASGDTRTYSESYKSVKQMVQDAIQETNLVVRDVSESENGLVTVYYIASDKWETNQHISEEAGKVRVQKNTDGIIKVEVEDPEYHYTVPDYEKEHYKRVLIPIFDRKMTPREEVAK